MTKKKKKKKKKKKERHVLSWLALQYFDIHVQAQRAQRDT